jgi:hypothetical protein
MEGLPVDERSDVWPMSANIFVLLSGLYPYYTVNNTKQIEKIIANGTLPYLDPRYKDRSFVERGMYDIMEQGFVVDPEQRVDIFTVVRHLRGIRDAVAAERQNGESAPYRGDELMKELARRIVADERKKERRRQQNLALGIVEETSSYGEYESHGDDDGETETETGDDD